MTNLKNNEKETSRPSAIDTAWTQLDVLSQVMTPVQILNDNSLQQELDFYTKTQLNDRNNMTATPITNTTPIASNNNNDADSSYFERSSNIQSNNLEYHHVNHYSTDQEYASLLFNQQAAAIASNDDSSSLLTYEPALFKSSHNQQQQNAALQSLYSNNSTPINSTPTSPIVSFDSNNHHYQQGYLNQHEPNYNKHPDQFATMFLSSTSFSSPSAAPIMLTEAITNTEKKNMQNIRFKQSNKHLVLDSHILSKHNMEQDKRPGIERLKNKQKATISFNNKKKKKSLKKSESNDIDEYSQEKQQEEEEEEEDDEAEERDNNEDEPVIGDGAQSYSSMGSNSSRSSQPLTKDDKRRRNTAASARFRIKKKMREQALQNTASEMTEKAQRMEQRVHELEREIKWLKALVVEKNEARIEQLVSERPPNSIAFPAIPTTKALTYPSTSSLSGRSNQHLMMMDSLKDTGNEREYEHEQDEYEQADNRKARRRRRRGEKKDYPYNQSDDTNGRRRY